MTADQIRNHIAIALLDIAPEIDLDDIDPTESFREEVDLDSMDLLAMTTALCKRLSIQIPQSEYPQLATLDDMITYLLRKVNTGNLTS